MVKYSVADARRINYVVFIQNFRIVSFKTVVTKEAIHSNNISWDWGLIVYFFFVIFVIKEIFRDLNNWNDTNLICSSSSCFCYPDSTSSLTILSAKSTLFLRLSEECDTIMLCCNSWEVSLLFSVWLKNLHLSLSSLTSTGSRACLMRVASS